MSEPENRVRILMADDDPDDRLMTKKALQKCRLANGICFVGDGQELMDYLLHRGQYVDPASSTRPDLILLDLNMPRKDGREALAEIKTHPDLRYIPVVVFTTSRFEKDVVRSYDLGGNSYIVKPASFKELAETMQVLIRYWFEIVRLPGSPGKTT